MIIFIGIVVVCNVGFLIGFVDIGISDDVYLFWIVLFGVRKEEGMCKVF